LGEAVPKRANIVYHIRDGFAGRPAYGRPTVALCSWDATSPVGKGSFENFNVKIFASPSTGSLSLWYNNRGRLHLAGSARGGCIPAAGGPTDDGALLLARLSLFSLHQLEPEPSQRGQFPRRDTYAYILQLVRPASF